jgi:hypothetical protein
MRKIITTAALAAVLAGSSVPAFAETGTSSAYGTEGYGPRVPTQSMTPFQRSWNANNESKMRARSSAAWMREHGTGFPRPW